MVAPTVDPADLDTALPDDCTVVHVIRSGGQRSVFEVTKAGQRCVLKLMPLEGLDRAEREVTLGRRFAHSGLATVISDLEEVTIFDVKYVYFLEEFVEGSPLDQLAGPLDICAALDLALQLVVTTEHLYTQHHVVHRDVKPPNIMCRPDGSYVLLDAGVARHQDLGTLTVDGGPHGPGTIGYLAPEQLQPSRGHELDWRSDQFVIGVVLFQQLTGRLPFDPAAPSYRTLLTTGTVTDWTDVPDAARPLLERMLQAKPHRRFRLERAAEHINNAKDAAGC